MVICLERGADLHMPQLMPLPLTVSCFSKIQIGFTFLVPAHLGNPGKRSVKWACVCCQWTRRGENESALFPGRRDVPQWIVHGIVWSRSILAHSLPVVLHWCPGDSTFLFPLSRFLYAEH